MAGFNLGEYKMEAAGGDSPKIYVYANKQLEDAILELLPKGATPQPPVALPPSFQSSRPHSGYGVMPDPPPPSPAAVLKRLGGQIADPRHEDGSQLLEADGVSFADRG